MAKKKKAAPKAKVSGKKMGYAKRGYAKLP